VEREPELARFERRDVELVLDQPRSRWTQSSSAPIALPWAV
jgi:hypothetical protein